MRNRPGRAAAIVAASAVAGVVCASLAAAVLVLLIGTIGGLGGCGAGGGAQAGPAGRIVLDPAGSGTMVGATEYGGPGDPSSTSTGARGDSLLAHPDSYAELGGLTWQTATAMGGLPVHDAAADHVGRAFGDRLQARLRLRRRPGRRDSRG